LRVIQHRHKEFSPIAWTVAATAIAEFVAERVRKGFAKGAERYADLA
jgi:hypothetical protein